MKRSIPMVVLALLATGCVSTAKYKEQESQTLQYQQKSTTLAAELEKSRTESEGRKAELEAAAKASKERETEISDLTAKLKNTTDELKSVKQSNAELSKSRDLAQKIAADQLRAASARAAKDVTEIEVILRRLNAFLEEKKTLEKSNSEALSEVSPKAEPAAATPAAPEKIH